MWRVHQRRRVHAAGLVLLLPAAPTGRLSPSRGEPACAAVAAAATADPSSRPGLRSYTPLPIRIASGVSVMDLTAPWLVSRLVSALLASIRSALHSFVCRALRLHRRDPYAQHASVWRMRVSSFFPLCSVHVVPTGHALTHERAHCACNTRRSRVKGPCPASARPLADLCLQLYGSCGFGVCCDAQVGVSGALASRASPVSCPPRAPSSPVGRPWRRAGLGICGGWSAPCACAYFAQRSVHCGCVWAGVARTAECIV